MKIEIIIIPLFISLLFFILTRLGLPSWVKSLKVKLPKRKSVHSIGEALYLEISKAELALFRGGAIGSNSLSRYKFFTTLIELVFIQKQNFGGGKKELIENLKAGLLRDLRFEKKAFSLKVGSYLQFIISLLVIWGFILLSLLVLDLSPSLFSLTLIAFWQLLGVISFHYLYRKIYARLMSPFPVLFSTLYSLKIFMGLSLPSKEIVERSNVEKLFLYKKGKFDSMVTRLLAAITYWQESGKPLTAEIESSLEEVWYLLDESYESMTQKLNLLKFLSLAIFFLPSYLLYVLTLVSGFFN